MLATKRKGNQHKKHEMYMANAKIFRLGPIATYIPLTRVGVLRFASSNAKDTNMLVYFALGNAKVPNANGFASQWNIGLGLSRQEII